ncbi:glycosyl transferase [Cryobacterium roopkundense]|uniref:Glycosyl transferase n=1 Tax=Cryobacterium roopkundense TaxID=1001240 RepID=A0A099J373_9MICO|nr:glycosyl transferase [Cryobacterium roopkundense]
MTVLQSFPVPRKITNPYIVMLAGCLRTLPDVTVLNFSWRTALLGRYDVFHSHWPENLVDGHSPLKKFVRQIFTLALVARLTITRTPIVRTMHNVERPQGLSRRASLLLDLIDRETTLRIRLNTTTIIDSAAPSATIPHGHYRDWFARYPPSTVVPGQIGYTGLIRRYKGVETLVSAFRDTEGTGGGLSLRIGGNPSSPELAQTVSTLASGDDRISLTLNLLTDAELVEIVTSSELVVLPYRFMHNSGGVLAALSMGRPVLVPENAVNRALACEVGAGWVHCYAGELTARHLTDTLHELRTHPAPRPVDLQAREWNHTGTNHVDAYRQAIAILHDGH